MPEGRRVYAIGDVHGEAALLLELLKKIAVDASGRETKPVTLILLGDLIDRGPGSASVLRALAQPICEEVIVIKGNHEEVMVDAYRGDDEALEFWMHFGGRATLESFGIARRDMELMSFRELRGEMHRKIDADLIDWLDSRPSSHVMGDYFFCHAGVRPGVALDAQSTEDLHWIRKPFLDSRKDHGKVVVHGHTVDAGPVSLGGNRINVETGGHKFGRMTALGLEGTEQWTIQANATELEWQSPEPAEKPAFLLVGDGRKIRRQVTADG